MESDDGPASFKNKKVKNRLKNIENTYNVLNWFQNTSINERLEMSLNPCCDLPVLDQHTQFHVDAEG